MEKVVAKRKVCHKAWRKSKSAEVKHTLDVAKKDVYSAAMTVQVTRVVSSEASSGLPSELLYADDLVIMAPTWSSFADGWLSGELACLAKD